MVSPVDEKGFGRIGGAVDVMERMGRKIPGMGLAEGLRPGDLAAPHNWAIDSAWAYDEQNPVRGRKLIYIVFFTFVAMIIWASVAPLDEVVSGSGKAVASEGTQVIQSVDGGMVTKIHARETQRVGKGDIIISLDPVRAGSMLGQQEAKVYALRLRAARLEALTSDLPFSPPPDLGQKAPEILDSERKLYETSRQELASRLEIIGEQIKQRRQELAESNARYSHANQSLNLASKELEMTRPLLASGAVPKIDIVRLEKAVAQASAERSQAGAQISRIKSSIQEAEGQINEINLRARGAWRAQLNDTLAELESLEEGKKALSDRMTHSEVKAPVTGTLKRLIVNSEGAVIMPGGVVAEIVPEGETVYVEVQLSPKDRAFIRPGQEAAVKFTAYEYAVYGGIDGTIESITPDTIVDQRGFTYYLGRVKIAKSGFSDDHPILPGMVAQVDIKTGKRTVMSYILRPLLRASSEALKER